MGNPDELLTWLTSTGHQPSEVISATSETVSTAEVTLDYVGSLDNVAVVLSRMHRGEKRLVFVDSRARAEQLALALRHKDVNTYVSHGSLGAGERRAAEQAFREQRDCVIVATSTLELGIDVGDLDRVAKLTHRQRWPLFFSDLAGLAAEPVPSAMPWSWLPVTMPFYGPPPCCCAGLRAT